MRTISPAPGEVQTNDKATMEAALKAMEAALLCLNEGNIAGATRVLYSALPMERRPFR